MLKEGGICCAKVAAGRTDEDDRDLTIAKGASLATLTRALSREDGGEGRENDE